MNIFFSSLIFWVCVYDLLLLLYFAGVSCNPNHQGVRSMYFYHLFTYLSACSQLDSIFWFGFWRNLPYMMLEGLFLQALASSVDYRDCKCNTHYLFPPNLEITSTYFSFYLANLCFFCIWEHRALHQNNLHGVIPNEITNCSKLRALWVFKFHYLPLL